MKKTAEIVIKTIGILLGGMLVCTLVLAGVFLLPLNNENLVESYDIIQKEGWYPAIPIVDGSLDTYFHSYLPGVLDDNTDMIMLETAMEPQMDNALQSAMDMKGYSYYWHGYVSVLRPLLCLFNYGEIRTLNGVLQLLLVMLLFLQIYKKKGMSQALMVITSYFLLMSLAMPFSLQFSWVFYIAIGGALALTTVGWSSKWSGIRLYWFFMFLGMCTSFFDLLTYPLFTWGFPLIWYLVLCEEDQNPLYYVKEVVFTGLWWILGYGGFWVSKWLMGSLVLGSNIFKSAWYEVFFCLGAEDAGGYNLYQRLEVLYINWKHYEYTIYVLILAVWLVWFAYNSIRKGLGHNKKNMALALIASSSIVWYLALSNHTGGHHFFTYRIYGVAVLAVLAIMTGTIEKAVESSKKQKVQTVCVWCVCGILACGLSLFAREDVQVSNGDRVYQKVAVQAGEKCEMRFTPAFPTVNEFSVCVETSAGEGECVIRILDEGTVLYEEEIPLEKYDNITHAAIPVLWKLERNHDYKMELSFEGADAETFLLVSENMDIPINEYGNVSVGGASQAGQILSVIKYSYRPLSLFTLGFLALTWCSVLFVIYVTFGVRKREKGNF